jgi:hypothetical protein
MPIDDRLRDSLRDAADDVRPDVEHHLALVRQRSQSAARRPGGLVTSVAAIAAMAVLAVAFAALLRGGAQDLTAIIDPAAPSQPATLATSPEPRDQADVLAGTYHARLGGLGVDGSAASMAGDWELTLGTDARVSLTPPAGFETPSGSPLEGYVYVLRGQSFFTNLFARHFEHSCVGSGAYRWELEGTRLTITAVDDLCLPRMVVLTTESWTRTDD